MFNPMDHPRPILVISFFAFWISEWIGHYFHERRRGKTEGGHGDFDLILGPTLTLLGLIIAFTFSMAVNRYDQRKDFEEQEANAIGTEYVRANLLPAADAEKVHALLKRYLDQRILHYVTRDEQQLRQINAQTARLQTEMWSAVVTAPAVLPPPVATLVLAGMNDVLNSQGYTQAAWWNRVPIAAWALLIALSIFCNLLIGYRTQERRSAVYLILPIALSICFFLISDIDSPRRGVILVQPQNLESLAESLH